MLLLFFSYTNSAKLRMPLEKVFILYLRRTRRKFNVYICERIDNF